MINFDQDIEIGFVKHFLELEKEIEIKYENGSVTRVPKTEHNLEKIKKQMEEQYQYFKNDYLTFLKLSKEKHLLRSFILGTAEVTLYLFVKDIPLPIIFHMINILIILLASFEASVAIYYQTKITKIKDMIEAHENLEGISFEGMNHLSLKSLEILEEDKFISLNNVEYFKHKEIQKMKKYVTKNIKD